MTLIHGDCIEVMAGMDPESVDAIVTDPPYGLEFMGKTWDRLGDVGKTTHSGIGVSDGTTAREAVYGRLTVGHGGSTNSKCRNCGKWRISGGHNGKGNTLGCHCEKPDFPNVKVHQARLMGEWHARWAEAAYRVAKPSAYLLAFGGTRTVHRMTVALEDAGWIIRDMLVWGYASGFPKSKASLKPAWEPIVMARKPGSLRILAVDACRIPFADAADAADAAVGFGESMAAGRSAERVSFPTNYVKPPYVPGAGRWPANIVLTDPIFDGGIEGVVGGGETGPAGTAVRRNVGRSGKGYIFGSQDAPQAEPEDDYSFGDSGTYSRFFLIPKADRADREPAIKPAIKPAYSGGAPERTDGLSERLRTSTLRTNQHPTVKPVDLMRHLVRLVTPTGGTVLDPFLGSGTTALAAEMEGFPWIGIEREAEYVQIAEARLNGTQRGLGLPA